MVIFGSPPLINWPGYRLHSWKIMVCFPTG